MGTVVVAYSVSDAAGRGTALELARLAGCRSIKLEGCAEACVAEVGDRRLTVAGFSEDVLYFDFLDRLFDAEFFIVVSRHSATSGVRSLTVHHTGNPTARAEYGGRPRELSVANPPVSLSILRSLSMLARDRGFSGVEVTYEVTHHGPTGVGRPLSFAEIGSSPSEWTHRPYQEALAEAVLRAIAEPPPSCVPSVGVGGGHYAQQFTQRALSLNECYGHIISRHVIRELRDRPELLELVLEEAVRKSSVPTRRIVLEGKMPAYARRAAGSVSSKYGLELVE